MTGPIVTVYRRMKTSGKTAKRGRGRRTDLFKNVRGRKDPRGAAKTRKAHRRSNLPKNYQRK